jgi:small subunit ribosomal protein S8
LIYKKNQPAISQIKLISKPGRRIYRRYDDLRVVRQGFGLAILSTSRGLMTNKEARKNKIGGEYLFEIY